MSFKLKSLLKSSAAAIALMSIAATPVKNDLVELNGFINAREEAKFRTSDDNKVYLLKPGTKAIVQEVKKFDGTGNYGLCLKVVNAELASGKDCYWVYHVPGRPTVKLLEVDADSADGKAKLEKWKSETKVSAKSLRPETPLTETKTPESAKAALVVKVTPAIKAPPTKVLPVASGTDGKNENKETAKTITAAAVQAAGKINQNTNKVTPSAANDWCPTCATAAAKSSYEICRGEDNADDVTGNTRIKGKKIKSAAKKEQAKEDYMGRQISEMQLKEPEGLVSQILANSAPSKYIKDECFVGSMVSFRFGPFKKCATPKSTPVLTDRACVSDKYLKLTRNSFDLVGDCLGTYMTSGNSSTVPAGMRMMFALASNESGLHSNAQSGTGAKGFGQFIEGRIEDVEKYDFRIMKNYLKEKMANCNASKKCELPARCEQVLKVVEGVIAKPYTKGEACSMLSLESGNPLKNMIYTAASQKISRSAMNKFYLKSKTNQRLFNNLSATDMDSLERQMGAWAHNRGDGGTEGALRAYLATYPAKDLSSSDIPQFLDGMKKYMIDWSRKNPHEPVQFLTNLNRRMESFDKAYGGGSCDVK